jgi:hypothetical protein
MSQPDPKYYRFQIARYAKSCPAIFQIGLGHVDSNNMFTGNMKNENSVKDLSQKAEVFVQRDPQEEQNVAIDANYYTSQGGYKGCIDHTVNVDKLLVANVTQLNIEQPKPLYTRPHLPQSDGVTPIDSDPKGDLSKKPETIAHLKDRIETAIHDRFPNSYIHMKESNLGGSSRPGLVVSFALGKDNTEWPAGIVHNDRGHTQFWIHGKRNEAGRITDLELSGSIYGYRDEKTHKSDKIGWRDIKKPTDIDGVMKNITKYFDNMKNAVQGLNKSKGASI